jgi:AcrR family transcriptional regulator
MPRSPRDGPATGAWQWSRTAQTQRALLDAARQVFTERGFAEASIADIVQRAGSSVGSLYHHFGGKSELFIALWQEHQLAHEEAAGRAVAEARKQGVTCRAAGNAVTWPCSSRPATPRPDSRCCGAGGPASGSVRTTRSCT